MQIWATLWIHAEMRLDLKANLQSFTEPRLKISPRKKTKHKHRRHTHPESNYKNKSCMQLRLSTVIFQIATHQTPPACLCNLSELLLRIPAACLVQNQRTRTPLHAHPCPGTLDRGRGQPSILLPPYQPRMPNQKAKKSR